MKRQKRFLTLNQKAQSVIIPSGQNLVDAAKLDQPMIEFRDTPLREIYKRLLKKVDYVLNPQNREIAKPKSIFNLMMSAKGSSLDVTKQICQLGHRAKWLENLQNSDSIYVEKFVIEKKPLETDEQHAIYLKFMQMKMLQMKYKIEKAQHKLTQEEKARSKEL